MKKENGTIKLIDDFLKSNIFGFIVGSMIGLAILKCVFSYILF